MTYFGKFYLDKDKDLVVTLDMNQEVLSYKIHAANHQSKNLIMNLAKISKQSTVLENNKYIMTGTIPCYIKGDGKKVYIFRLNGTKLANIYPNGEIEVNSCIPAIAKTLMSQTKDYQYSFRDTLIKSYVPEYVKLSTDLHTHANANLHADILIALAIKHQIRYPLYYIKKLHLQLSKEQEDYIQQQRYHVKNTLDVSGLSGKYVDRKIDDFTFINFADLILNNPQHSTENINKIRNSLMILKDSQAVFTNLEKLYLYRYVFTKGQKADYRIDYMDISSIEDIDIREYLHRMLKDMYHPEYSKNTLYEDTLLWIGREYQRRHIKYVEISDTTLVKKDSSNAKLLAQIHRILPLVKQETGVDIRFLAAIRRIPLTLVKENIVSNNYLTEAMQALKVVCKDPYVVGSDFVGEEINDIEELKEVVKEIVQKICIEDENWTVRMHAGENDSLKTNMYKSIQLVEQVLLPNQKFPYMRIGHGVYSASLHSKQGKDMLDKIRKHNVVLEFQLTSNVRLNNVIELKQHPLNVYLKHNVSCVMGTDGCGLYGTDSLDEQLALINLLKVQDEDFLKMKAVENDIIERQTLNFDKKMSEFNKKCMGSVEEYYTQELSKELNDILDVHFAISKYPSYPVVKSKVMELPWDKYPVVIAGGSFTHANTTTISETDKEYLLSLMKGLDPKKVFFVVGHKLSGQEAFVVENNPGFDIYAMVPSLMSHKQLVKLQKANIKGIRISTESQEMGIYKSFNYEIFERRNCALITFDGNSSMANLIQEARNGKGRCWIFMYPKSKMLKAKANSLQGYVTIHASCNEVISKICEIQDNIGTKR